MTQKNGPIGRREFVGQVSRGLLAAGAALSTGAGAVSAAQDVQAAAMPYVTLGRTGLRVSKISLGTNPPTSRPVLAYSVAQGVNYIDTAELYARGRAEEIVGELFQELGLERSKFCLSTKTFDRNPENWPARVGEACKRLRTKYVDLFFIHDLGMKRQLESDKDPNWIHNDGVVRAAKALKESGRVRFFGYSVHRRNPEHTYGLIREAARRDVIDVIMLQYNFRDAENEPLREAMALARKAKIGLIACKPQGGNRPVPEHLKRYMADGFSRWQAAIRWLANDPLVDVVCSNMLNMQQAKENIAAIKAPPLESAHLRSLRMYAAATASEYCHACERCLDVCPQGIDVPTVLRAVMYHEDYGQPEMGRETYASVAPAYRADRCSDCAGCEQACPHGLPIRRRLQRTKALFGAGA